MPKVFPHINDTYNKDVSIRHMCKINWMNVYMELSVEVTSLLHKSIQSFSFLLSFCSSKSGYLHIE